MRQRFARFMQGRYGVDQFSNFLVITALVLMILELVIPVRFVHTVFNLLGVLLLFYAYFRILSRNHGKRYAENERYMKYHNKFWGMAAKRKSRMEQRRVYRIYKCPSCKQSIRVPKGKGKIAITCPKCRTEFIRKS